MIRDLNPFLTHISDDDGVVDRKLKHRRIVDGLSYEQELVSVLEITSSSKYRTI